MSVKTSGSHPSLSQAELGAQTRERLLDAAERLFAERGFATASVRDITAAAGCNLAAVNYHFGGKHGLYGEVFRRRLAVMREQRMASIRQSRTGTASLEETLRDFAATFLRPLVDKERGSRLIEMISREMLDPRLPRELLLTEVVGPVQEELAKSLVAAVPGLRRGQARLCVISIVGQLLQVANRLRRAEVSKGWNAGLPSLHRIVDQIVRFSAAGVRACAEGEGRGPRAM